MSVLHLDIETYSECDLRATGVYRYAVHPSTELLLACYAFDDGPVKVWIPQAPSPAFTPITAGLDACVQPTCPAEVAEHIRNGGTVAAHNAQFERVMLRDIGPRYGFPEIQAEQCDCTAARSAYSGLPRSLGNAAAAVGTHPKNDDGRNVMLQMARPRTGAEKRYTPAEHPDKWRTLIDYCIDDVKAERDLGKRLRPLSPVEHKVYVLDQRINDRGVGVDMDAVRDMQHLVAAYQAELETECKRLTGLTPTQTGKLADWIRAAGYPQLVDLQAASVQTALADEDCPPEVKAVLRIRTTHAMKAVAKYEAMRNAERGGRLYGAMMYHGAATGRWSSQIVQLQNIARPAIKDPDTAIAACAERDLTWIRTLYDTDPMRVFASCVRGMLVPANGKRFISVDYSGIENRVLPWLLPEPWKLKAFEAFDAGTGPDLYVLAYSRMFRISPEEVDDFQRQIGKVVELSMGYEGGVNAFVTMAKNYKLDLKALAATALPVIPDDTLYDAERAWAWAYEHSRAALMPKDVFIACDSLKRLWRDAHPNVVRGWRDLVDAGIMAVTHPGKVYAIPGRRIAFKMVDETLYCRLPSGRALAYFRPEVEEADDRGRKTLTYMGVDTYTRRWMRVPTYGGRLAENVTQALSRDVLVHGLFAAEAEGYPVVLSVHDELVTEVDEGVGSVDGLVAAMCAPPAWADGLPLAARGWEGKRYRK